MTTEVLSALSALSQGERAGFFFAQTVWTIGAPAGVLCAEAKKLECPPVIKSRQCRQRACFSAPGLANRMSACPKKADILPTNLEKKADNRGWG
jgi:hypothetical protein